MIRKPSGREVFLAQLKPYMLEDELEHVHAAYVFAKYGHRAQVRQGGDCYFEHPKAVANILIRELSVRDDWQLIVTALLHDLLEDSWLLSEDRVRRNFGRRVAWWVKLL
ncbi:MAG: HD domain-containing protein, partial [Patescibacteria group bacterium]